MRRNPQLSLLSFRHPSGAGNFMAGFAELLPGLQTRLTVDIPASIHYTYDTNKFSEGSFYFHGRPRPWQYRLKIDTAVPPDPGERIFRHVGDRNYFSQRHEAAKAGGKSGSLLRSAE